MNERIKELARQVDACYIPRYDMWQMDTESLKNLAELIVKECAEYAEHELDMAGYKKKFMLQHFGVE